MTTAMVGGMERHRVVSAIASRARIGWLVIAIAITSSSAAAQYGQFTADRSLRTDAHLAMVNASLGALTAATSRWLRGDPVRTAIRDGAIGGVIAYGGKRLSVERFAGAGFAGRQVGSIGHSIVRNAADGRPLLRRLVLPVGPLRLYLRPDSLSRLRARVDLATAVYALLVSLNNNEFDVRESLSSGAMVFRSTVRPLSDRKGQCLAGLTVGGVIVMNDMTGRGTDDRNPAYAHERVHVTQHDQLFVTLSDPFEERIAGNASWKRYVDLNVLSPLLLIPSVLMPWDDLPWEIEAMRITRQTFGDAPLPPRGVFQSECRTG